MLKYESLQYPCPCHYHFGHHLLRRLRVLHEFLNLQRRAMMLSSDTRDPGRCSRSDRWRWPRQLHPLFAYLRGDEGDDHTDPDPDEPRRAGGGLLPGWRLGVRVVPRWRGHVVLLGTPAGGCRHGTTLHGKAMQTCWMDGFLRHGDERSQRQSGAARQHGEV